MLSLCVDPHCSTPQNKPALCCCDYVLNQRGIHALLPRLQKINSTQSRSTDSHLRRKNAANLSLNKHSDLPICEASTLHEHLHFSTLTLLYNTHTPVVDRAK